MGVAADGTAEIGVRVSSVTFFQLRLLEADDEARAASGAGLRLGIWICGLAFFNFCLGTGTGALTMASIVRAGIGTLGIGRSRSLRARVLSSRSRREIWKTDWLVFFPADLGRLIGPVQSVTTVGLIGSTVML